MKVLRFLSLMLLVVLPAVVQAQDKPRVFISDSQSWSSSGGGLVRGRGGARPQTAEIVKTFNKRCARCVVTMEREKADYVVVLDHEGGKTVLRRDNKFVVFNKDGDAIRSGSTRSLGNAVEDACGALSRDWRSRNTESW